jgi:hypothetical protein
MDLASKNAAVALLAVAAVVATSCTTMIRPVHCPGQPYQCNEVHDATFCEYRATKSEGPDCAELGLSASSHFCVVTGATCVVETSYAVPDRLCRVTQLEMLREGGECRPGLPTFMAP